MSAGRSILWGEKQLHTIDRAHFPTRIKLARADGALEAEREKSALLQRNLDALQRNCDDLRRMLPAPMPSPGAGGRGDAARVVTSDKLVLVPTIGTI